MKRYFLLFLILILALTFKPSQAQTTSSTSYSGNLVKISMLSKSASLSDTLGRWVDYSYYSPQAIYVNSTYYTGHITLPEHSYLIKKNTGYRGYFIEEYWGHNYIETEGQNLSRPFSITGSGWDVIPPYFIESTEVTSLSCGSWLINGVLGSGFIDNKDSLRIFKGFVGRESSQSMEENLISILGRVGDRYLAVFVKDYLDIEEFEYRLVNLSNSPYIGEYSPAIKFYGTSTPDYKMHWLKVKQVYNDLYIGQGAYGPGLCILRFADTSFNYVKPAFLSSQTQTNMWKDGNWEFKNGKYYVWEGLDLCTYDFNLADTTLVNRKVLLKVSNRVEQIGMDRDFRYLANIDGDTLRIFDIDKESCINAISIKGVKSPIRPIVDYPYVYLHQTTFEENSSIVKVEENSSVVKSYSLSAYPNPFNPVTTLEFNLPFAGHVELKIYDALGKEVTTLVNEERNEGSYKIQFNASSLPSGIYLCRMSAGSYTVTKKVVLLK